MLKIDVGASQSFQRTVRQCERFARSDWPVLIAGETGVGKELLAHHIHQHSFRKRYPFIPINCGAMPASLFESELFGHEKGSFSGATHYFRGLIRAAHGGTLFLDEIGDLEPALQVKLLRVLETGEIRSVGSAKLEKLNVRFVAATNVNLSVAVAENRFRHDLLQRLSVLSIHVPPLRDRKEDIPALVSELLEEIHARASQSCLPLLRVFDWPGNVRQLKNILIRAAVLSEGEITPQILQPLLEEERAHLPATELDAPTGGTLADIERRVIVDTLKRYHGNRKRTAKELGIAKSTLHEKLRKWREEAEQSAPWPICRNPDESLVAEP